MRAREPALFKATVIDVRSHGLVVELPDVLFTGMIHVSRLPDDFYTFDATRLEFRGRRGKNAFGLGAILQVKVCRVDPFKKQVDFEPVGKIEGAETGSKRPGKEHFGPQKDAQKKERQGGAQGRGRTGAKREEQKPSKNRSNKRQPNVASRRSRKG